jgi:hypothetical protein
MNGLFNHLPFAASFFQHSQFIRIAFVAVFCSRFFVMADPCCIPVNAHLLIGVHRSAADVHVLYIRMKDSGRRNIECSAVGHRSEDAGTRLNFPVGAWALMSPERQVADSFSKSILMASSSLIDCWQLKIRKLRAASKGCFYFHGFMEV